MQIAWRPQMAVDHGLIDKDHWTLLQIISEFTDIRGDLPGADVPGGILLKLDHYAKVHFEREQWLQQKIGYPYADAHEHEHRDLTKRLDMMREKFKADGTPEEIAAAHHSVGDLLRGWLVDHIVHSDLRMRPYSASLRRGASGIVDLTRAASP